MRWLCFSILTGLLWSCSPARPGRHDFVYLHEAIPTIVCDIRYHNTDNFVGKPVDGYLKPVALISKEAADALAQVQEALNKEGLGLKVFDAYRPQKAVDHFVKWAGIAEDTLTRSKYYPGINKADLFALGYVARRSSHTRGSTVDLTLIDLNSKEELDMGSRWDFFSELSHHDSPLVAPIPLSNRNKLRRIMRRYGFNAYKNEWWHYTLAHEPFPDTYFNFDVK